MVEKFVDAETVVPSTEPSTQDARPVKRIRAWAFKVAHISYAERGYGLFFALGGDLDSFPRFLGRPLVKLFVLVYAID